ncbi:MAG: hypothetical protein GF307_07270, partial [candidate division Zixibacteria bacterium]|nr:hypothetical protein [candidate division Zixibacteria bacterium]
MKKLLVLTCIFALGIAGSVFAANPAHIANNNPVGGDILVADNCDAGALWTQEPEDCDGSWALVTSDTDLGYCVYDDYAVNGTIQQVTVWYGDLVYNMGWSECSEDPMPVNVYFCADNGGIPDFNNPTYTESLNLTPVFLCQLSGVYDVYRADFALSQGVTLASGWFGIEGIGNGDTCVFMWYNSTTGNGVNSYQTGIGPTTYEQAFCLYGEQEPMALACDLTIVSPYVPSIGGNILFDFTVTNTGANAF